MVPDHGLGAGHIRDIINGAETVEPVAEGGANPVVETGDL